MFFKSPGRVSQTIFIQSTWNFAYFFVIRLSSKIRKGFLISWKLSNLWPVFDNFFSWKIRTSTLNLQKFINIQYFQNLIRILLDISIIKKIFVWKNYCSCAANRGATNYKKKNYTLKDMCNKSLQSHFVKILFVCLEKSRKKNPIFSLLQPWYNIKIKLRSKLIVNCSQDSVNTP